MEDLKDLATFQFLGFQIPHASFNTPEEQFSNLEYKLGPTGMFYTQASEYDLTLLFDAVGYNKEGEGRSSCQVTIQARFVFNPKIASKDEIPEYFFQNSIAIVFPYLRSFISSLTLQTNTRIIVLPIVNLSHLAYLLKSTTHVVE